MKTPLDLGSARHWARAYQQAALGPGGAAIDATMGNGGDTLAFCELTGPEGRVYAFDVQPLALENTRVRLEEAGVSERARLFLAGHEDMAQYVHERVDAIAFNLGWLPGSPDKSLTTRTETTLRALDAALSLLKVGGVLTLCVYPGHPEGARELEAVLDWAGALDSRTFQALVKRYLNQPAAAPVLIVLQRLRG